MNYIYIQNEEFYECVSTIYDDYKVIHLTRNIQK